MNRAIKRTKLLREFTSMLLMTFYCTLYLSPIFPFLYELPKRNLPKPLQENSLQPQDFVLMKLQDCKARGQEHIFYNVWAEF